VAALTHTWTPWSVDSIETAGSSSGDKYLSYGVFDATGRAIVDAMNSSVAEIREEDDGEPAGFVTRWDEQGRADCEHIAHAVNCHAKLVDAIGDVLSDMMFCVAPSKWTLSKCREALAMAAPHLGLHHAPKAVALQKP
jgi:hypothetical protein